MLDPKRATPSVPGANRILLLALLLCTCLPAIGADYTRDVDRAKIIAPTDEAMFERFLEVVRKGEIDREFLKRDPAALKFSDRLQAAARKGKGITLIKPVAKNHDYFSTDFQKVLDDARQGRCRDWKLNHSYDWSEWLANKQRFKSLSAWEDHERTSGEVQVYHYDFKLYHVDIDHNPTNGKEWVFYASGKHYINHGSGGPYKMFGESMGGAEYEIVDFDHCKSGEFLSIDDPVDRETLSPTGNITGMFEFEGKAYVFQGHQYRSGKVSLFIQSNLSHPIGSFALRRK